ncbi:MAG: T9SS type A sorting domain-containing protein [Bacteroidota bacterium]
MKTYLILVLCLVINSITQAQVMLTVKDTTPPGTSIIFNYITDTSVLNNFRFGKTGANNVWDFSKLGVYKKDTVKIISPEQTAYKENFSDCHSAFVEIDATEGTYYRKSDTNGYYEVGFADFFSIAPFIQVMRYQHPLPILLFPVTHSYLNIDTNYIRTNTFLYHSVDSAYCERYSYTKREAVASGIIKLPFGNFESFLLKNTFFYIDTTWVKDANGSWNSQINVMPSQYTSFDWFCNKSTFFVARVLGWSEYPAGVDNQDRILVQMNNYANLQGTSVIDIEPASINIYPNPASTKLYIESMAFKHSNYIISDISGRELKKGMLQTEIAIDDLQSGIYIISLHAKNELYRKKFIKQ